MSTEITVMAVGDVILDEPGPASFFDPARETLLGADVAVAHIEVPHTDSTERTSTDVPQFSGVTRSRSCRTSFTEPGSG